MAREGRRKSASSPFSAKSFSRALATRSRRRMLASFTVRVGGSLPSRTVAALQHFRAALFGHFQKEQVGELLDVVALVHAAVARRVAEAPESLDDVGHG